MKMISALLAVAAAIACLGACLDDPLQLETPGALALSLSSRAGGVEYRLSQARFRLEGAVERELEAGDEPVLTLELRAGTYSLRLLDGYQLTRADDASATQVSARLVSANPAPFTIVAGQTARLTLRFELSAVSSEADAGGALAVDLAVDSPDAASPACAASLHINEIDYEQAGTDEAELIELLNTSSCAAELAGLVLELLNGGDGKVYARYELGAAGSRLPAGARLVLGDASVIGALPAGSLSLTLNGSGLQNGPDGVRLLRGDLVLDAVSYEGAVPGLSANPALADEGEGSLSRCPDAFDSDDASHDFRLVAPSPGAANLCD